MADLGVEFLGTRFKNPLVAAAGPLTWNEDSLSGCIMAGAGAVTLKSAALDPGRWEKPARQSLYFLDRYDRRGVLSHCTGWFHSFDEEARIIESIGPLARKEGARVIGNILCDPPPGGLNAEGLAGRAKQLESAGADMLELAIGSPTVVAGLSPAEKDTERAEVTASVLRAVKGKLGIPYYVKIGYDSAAGFLRLLKTIGEFADACHIIPEFCATFIDIETGRPVAPLPKLYGRFTSGTSAYFTALAVRNSRLQIMTGGGLWTWRDVVESLMCGATLTAVQTAALYQGSPVFTKMLEGVAGFMARKGYEKVSDLRGIAVPHIDNTAEMRSWMSRRQLPVEAVAVVVDAGRCDGCGRCTACVFGAVEVRENVALIEAARCMRCGLCATVCPRDAIVLEPRL